MFIIVRNLWMVGFIGVGNNGFYFVFFMVVVFDYVDLIIRIFIVLEIIVRVYIFIVIDVVFIGRNYWFVYILLIIFMFC